MSKQRSPDVGNNLRNLRQQRGLSLRALAELCGLSPNTISLIERGITSPSVITLHRLAGALGVPITFLFQDPAERVKVMLTRADLRPRSRSSGVLLESLGYGLVEQACDPFVVTLEPGGSNGRQWTAHPGHELVYCLQGELGYEIASERYQLTPGDALLFHADLPHGWRNTNHKPAVFLLFIAGTEGQQESMDQHLSL